MPVEAWGDDEIARWVRAGFRRLEIQGKRAGTFFVHPTVVAVQEALRPTPVERPRGLRFCTCGQLLVDQGAPAVYWGAMQPGNQPEFVSHTECWLACTRPGCRCTRP